MSQFSKIGSKTIEKFNSAIDINDIENPELKTFEENFYFTCQLSIRKLLRLFAKFPGSRNRYGAQTSVEDGTAIACSIATVLNGLADELNLTEGSPE